MRGRPWRRNPVALGARLGLAGRVAALAAESEPQGNAPAVGGPPSDAARARFAGAMSREVDTLRTELSDEILWSLLALDAGDVDGAASILDSGAGRLDVFRLRLEDAIAAAAVEREAERVIVQAAELQQAAPRPAARVRAVGVAFAGLVAAVVGLDVVGPSPSDDHLLVSAGHEDLSPDAAILDVRGEAPDTPAGDADAAPAAALGPSAEDVLGGTGSGGGSIVTASGHDQVTGVQQEMLALLREPEAFIARMSDQQHPTGVAALLDVDRLMARLLPNLPEVDGSLAVDVQDTIAASPQVGLDELPIDEVAAVTVPAEVTEGTQEGPRVTVRRPLIRAERSEGPSEEPSAGNGSEEEQAPEPSPTPNEGPPEPTQEPTEDPTSEPTDDGDGRDGGGGDTDGRDGGDADGLVPLQEDDID